MSNTFDDFKADVINTFSECEDFVCFTSGRSGARFALMFVKGITARDFISERLLRPLQMTDIADFDGDFGRIVESPNLSFPTDAGSAARDAAIGEVIIIIESKNGFFAALANAQQTHGRSVDEPDSDVTVRGPKAGFVEDAETNMALIRKYIRTPDLKFVRFTVGEVSNTKVIISYVSGRASADAVNSIKQKISKLKATAITDSTNIAMLLEGNKSKLLPTCGSTEKVDKCASKLMSGRIAVIVDGSPFVLTVPFVFAECLQSADDYLHTPYYATFIRILRLIAFVSAIFAPAVLCALVSFDYAQMPPELYGLIADSRKDIPLSFFWEVVAILLLFEILREVGVRMPRSVGEAVGIVGSIILGNTAVEAGIVSSIGVITVAFSAVCAFITPAYMYVIVIARIASLLLAEIFGIYGLGIASTVLLLMICGKNSFGVPYLTPLSPFDKKGMQDFIYANPKKTLGRRELDE
ncbi:MAG: spore germination protein [Clostridia bacterium]|nr:spore germination protein [Clostridia bacterium]